MMSEKTQLIDHVKLIGIILIGILLLFIPSILFAADSPDEAIYGPNRLRGSTDVTVYRETDRRIPEYVEGTLSDIADKGTEIEKTFRFFEINKDAFRMTDPREELRIIRISDDRYGMKHLRIQQYYHGLKVIGGDLITHFTSDGRLKTVNGYYHPDISIEYTPILESERAIEIALDDLNGFFGGGNPDSPELVIFPWEDTYYLAWRMFVFSETPMGRWEYFVNATNGEVIFKANRIMNSDVWGSGIDVMGNSQDYLDIYYNDVSTYYMIDYTRRANNNVHGHDGQMPSGSYIQTNIAGSSLPGSVATDADNVWDNTSVQSPAVSGHIYTGLVYDWLLHAFNRNGYNDAGATMITSVNYNYEGDNNAYWNGSQIVIWSWSTGWRSLAGCPDVIAHEWGHAVTEYCSNLVYQKEPGALNESFSDMIGAAFEFAHDTMDVPDWYMGENGRTTGIGFRSMSNPHEFGDPDTYGTVDPYWVDVEGCTPSYYNDYCGVHTNSGVGNKWFYLLSDGGTHNGIIVSGIGVENAIQIAYRANKEYWTSSSDYHNAALGTISAANDLDPSGIWAGRVAQAWKAVLVDVPGPSLAFDYPAGTPTMLEPNVATDFQISVTGTLGGVPESSSGLLFYSVDGRAYVSVAATHLSGDLYEATLPAEDCDSRIDYYLRFNEQATGFVYDPDPASPYSAIVATEENIVFEDDFNTSTGWTVTGDAGDGQWGRGVPVGGGDRGDPPTDYDGSGYCYLTDNVDGNSDVDDGTTNLLSPSFDLQGNDARISYAYWYSNDFGAAPNTDVMRFFISNNNGGNWVKIDSAGPVNNAGGGWIEHSFWVSEFTTPTGQMMMKFEASDLGDGSVVEAGIDAFKIVSYTCNSSSLNITTTSLPDWTSGVGYSQQLTAGGGTGNLTWADKNNDLDGSGLTLSSDGLISGTPGVSGILSFIAQVTDESKAVDEQPLEIVINAPVQIQTASLPEWTVNIFYTQQLTASGGTGTLLWTDQSGGLVGTGLVLLINGQITGTPNSSGPISFTAGAADQIGSSDNRLLDITINGAVSIITSSLPDGKVDDEYLSALISGGGTGTISWSDKNGDLAGSGLTLTSDGKITGIPLNEGALNFTAVASDAPGSIDEKYLEITINPAFICGDATGDELVNLADILLLIAYVYNNPPGPAPDPLASGDVDGPDGHGLINLADILYLISYVYADPPGSDPVCP